MGTSADNKMKLVIFALLIANIWSFTFHSQAPTRATTFLGAQTLKPPKLTEEDESSIEKSQQTPAELPEDRSPITIDTHFLNKNEGLVYDPKTARFYERSSSIIPGSKPIPLEDIEPLAGPLQPIDVEAFKLMADRTVDTVEDALLIAKRKFQAKRASTKLEDALARQAQGKESEPSADGDSGGVEYGPKKKRVVLLGFGWGGHALSKVIDTFANEVVIVSPRNYFLFTPLLASTTVGTVEFRSITEPVRLANPAVSYYEGTCVEVRPEAREIVVESLFKGPDGEPMDRSVVKYDQLVCAQGVKSGTFGVKGVREYCYFLKEIEDARRLRTAIIKTFEYASFPSVSEEEARKQLSFVVVGGGPTGVEFSAELLDFLNNDVPRLYKELQNLVSLTIVQREGRILPIFDEVLSSKGLDLLVAKGVNFRLGKTVGEVKQDEIVLTDGSTLPYGVAIWAAGTEPWELTKSMISSIPEQAQSPSAKKGKLATDQWMRVKGTNGTILALGDCSDIEGAPLPQTGQVAAQQGAYVARLVNRKYNLGYQIPTREKPEEGEADSTYDYLKLRGRVEAVPFQFLNLGILAYLGDANAVAQVQTGDTVLVQTVGNVGFLLWRSIYAVKQVSLRTRLLVLFDWAKSRMFGRDITTM